MFQQSVNSVTSQIVVDICRGPGRLNTRQIGPTQTHSQ